MHIHYIVVSATNSLEELQNRVNDKIIEGYRVTGGVAVSHITEGIAYHQAMTRQHLGGLRFE